MEKPKSQFQFKGFKVLKSVFKISEDYEKLEDFNFGLDIKGVYRKKEKRFNLYLNMIIEDKSFLCEVNSLGFFILDDIEDDTFVNNYLFTNAPALLFPYLRSYISTLTTQSGIDSIVLPTMNLSKIVQEDFSDNFEIID